MQQAKTNARGPYAIPSSPKRRLLIFVVAYHAESTLVEVLERIPSSVYRDYDCEILVVDDASTDRTFAIGQEYRAQHPEVAITVLRNAYNQGYGGNQKVGYTYAITEGFDFVALLHGDAQYAPEELPRLIEPLRDNRADAVFGSRMLVRSAALRGGMPLYKFVGNIILTAIENYLVGTHLSEFHSGYRVYSTAALRRIPFHLNTNDFHFDTEIILQLTNAAARIVELPIPTYYGNEISRVNGLRYARDVVWACIRNLAHRNSLLYYRRFDTVPEGQWHYELKLGYASSHSWAIEAVPAGASVLDIGSYDGRFARELLSKCSRVGIVDRVQPRHPDPRIESFVQDLDEPLRFSVKNYRYLLLLDIVEHLHDPEHFFEELRQQFDYEPKRIIFTTANIAFLPVRFMHLIGQFNYGRQGILDRTHHRLFTFRSAVRLLRDAGLRIVSVRGVPAPFPMLFGMGFLGRAALAANLWLIRVSRGLFSYQIYIEAETTPDIDFVLADTKRTGTAEASVR